MNSKQPGTITFTSFGALALWEGEILGQMSDGLWENSRPHDHWEFWNRLTPSLGEAPALQTNIPGVCSKRSYALTKLLPIIGDRMVKLGRMGTAANTQLTGNQRSAADYMPATLVEWTSLKESGKWQHDWIAKYMADVSPALAAAYYNCVYTVKRSQTRSRSYQGGDELPPALRSETHQRTC